MARVETVVIPVSLHAELTGAATEQSTIQIVVISHLGVRRVW